MEDLIGSQGTRISSLKGRAWYAGQESGPHRQGANPVTCTTGRHVYGAASSKVWSCAGLSSGLYGVPVSGSQIQVSKTSQKGLGSSDEMHPILRLRAMSHIHIIDLTNDW